MSTYLVAFVVSKFDNRKYRFKNISKLLIKIFFLQKELSYSHKFWFCNSCIFATQCRQCLIFQTMISVKSNNPSFKYQRLTPSGCKDIWRYSKVENVRKYVFFLKKNLKSERVYRPPLIKSFIVKIRSFNTFFWPKSRLDH